MMKRDVKKAFSENFNRLSQGMTVQKLAQKMYISVGSVNNWRSDDANPNIENLAMIADYFNVSPNYLLDYDTEPTLKRCMQEFRDYTGLDKETISVLHKKRDNALFTAVINYFLTDDELMEELVCYLMTNLYTDFENDKRYKFLPKRRTYSARKHQIYDIVEKLSTAKERFTNFIRGNKVQREKIEVELWDKEINREGCFRILQYPFPDENTTYQTWVEYDEMMQQEMQGHPERFEDDHEDIDFGDVPAITPEEQEAAKKYLREHDEYRKKKSSRK